MQEKDNEQDIIDVTADEIVKQDKKDKGNKKSSKSVKNKSKKLANKSQQEQAQNKDKESLKNKIAQAIDADDVDNEQDDFAQEETIDEAIDIEPEADKPEKSKIKLWSILAIVLAFLYGLFSYIFAHKNETTINKVEKSEIVKIKAQQPEQLNQTGDLNKELKADKALDEKIEQKSQENAQQNLEQKPKEPIFIQTTQAPAITLKQPQQENTNKPDNDQEQPKVFAATDDSEKELAKSNDDDNLKLQDKSDVVIKDFQLDNTKKNPLLEIEQQKEEANKEKSANDNVLSDNINQEIKPIDLAITPNKDGTVSASQYAKVASQYFILVKKTQDLINDMKLQKERINHLEDAVLNRLHTSINSDGKGVISSQDLLNNQQKDLNSLKEEIKKLQSNEADQLLKLQAKNNNWSQTIAAIKDELARSSLYQLSSAIAQGNDTKGLILNLRKNLTDIFGQNTTILKQFDQIDPSAKSNNQLVELAKNMELFNSAKWRDNKIMNLLSDQIKIENINSPSQKAQKVRNQVVNFLQQLKFDEAFKYLQADKDLPNSSKNILEKEIEKRVKNNQIFAQILAFFEPKHAQ